MRTTRQRQALASLAAAICLACTVPLGPARAQTQPSPAFDLAAAKAHYKRPPARPVGNPALVDLGRHLFWDPRISASGRTSCVSCHPPYLGWATTDARSRSDSEKPTSRKSQPLMRTT